jgi:LacI family transcriptional regulator
MFQAGFLMAQAEMEASQRIPVLRLVEAMPNDNTARLAAWLKKFRPDAILTDYANLPEMLQKMGYKIPDDLGLAALSVLDGNIDAGIDQNPEEIGRVAFLMAFTLINDNSRGIPPIIRQTLVFGKWVDGKCLPDRGK